MQKSNFGIPWPHLASRKQPMALGVAPQTMLQNDSPLTEYRSAASYSDFAICALGVSPVEQATNGTCWNVKSSKEFTMPREREIKIGDKRFALPQSGEYFVWISEQHEGMELYWSDSGVQVK